MPTAFDPSLLLAETNWLRRLVRGLVIDEASADDVVQETMLRALERPPRDVEALPGWLRAVARNEALQVGRRSGARARRERAASRPEATAETPDAVVAKAEAQTELGRRVLALEEPYRTTLLLRYVEDLTPTEIAARQGLSGGTVRSRLKRGLDLLREDLDRESGGDRRAWVGALLPLADLRPPVGGVGAGPIGALLMTTQAKVTAAVVTLLAAAGLWLALRPAGDGTSGRGGSGGGGTPLAEAPALEGRGPKEAATPKTPEREPAPVPSEKRAPRVGLAFVDEAGRAVPAGEARARYTAAGVPARVTWVSAEALEDGSLKALLAAHLGSRDLWQRDEEIDWSGGEAAVAAPEEGRWRLFVDRPGAAPWLGAPFAPAGSASALEIRLATAPSTVLVRLLAADSKAPLANAEAVPFHEYGDDTAFFAGSPRRADGGGEVRLPLFDRSEDPRGRGATWWVRTATHAGSLDSWRLARWTDPAPLQVELQPTATAEGEAFTSEGAPAAGLEVVWWQKGLVLRTRADPEGRFRLAGIPLTVAGGLAPVAPDGDEVRLVLVEDAAAAKFAVASAKVRPGAVTSGVRIGKPRSADDASLAGRITVGGRPLGGVFVQVGEKAKDGRVVPTDEDGRFRAAGMKPGPVDVRVWFGDPRVIDDFSAQSTKPLLLEAGRERRVDLDLPDGVVRLTIVDADSGALLPSAVGWGRPAERGLEASRFEGMVWSAGWGGRVAADGTILLRGLVPGHAHVVAAGAEGYAEAEQGAVLPGTNDAPVEVTLRLRRKP